MNPAQIQGIIRSVVIAIGGVVSTLGWLDSVDWAAIGGALATLGGAVWSVYSNSDTSLVNQAAQSDDVHEIVVDKKTADAAPSPKVVPLT